MAQYQWAFDSPTGTFKNHALSQRLYLAAVQKCVFGNYVRPVEGFGRKMGDTVTLTRIRNITEPTSGTLNEGQRIPEDTFALSTTSITVSEYGRSLPYTSLAEDLTFFDVESPIQMKLRDQMQLTIDAATATAFKTAQVKYAVSGTASNNIATTGTFGATSSDNMSVWHVEQIRDYLYDTLYAPPYEGEDYIGIFRTLGLRGIKNDPAWEMWHKYTDPEAKYNGEVGRIEGIRFVETNHSTALSKVGTSSVLGEGVVFGQDAVAMAEVLTPELRAAIPADFGRSKAVAWYGILAWGLIWSTANAGEARVIHVGSL